MKKLILFALLAMLPLQGAFIGQFVGPYIGRAIRSVGRDIAHGPLAYAGLAGTTALAYNCKDNTFALAGIGISFLAYHMSIAKSWWWLRKESRSYPDTFTDRDLLKRTAWHNPYEEPLNTGFDIMRYYQKLDPDRKAIFVNNLKNKVAEEENPKEALPKLERALGDLKQKIQEYGKFSNLYYAIKTAAGSDPLTTDYLFENNIQHPASTVSVVLADHTKGSWIANSFKIRWAYSPTLGIAVPWWYTWSHRIASQCIVKALYQYGRLKAIRKILETHIPAPNPAHNLNVRVV